jgi:hypothetical protein
MTQPRNIASAALHFAAQPSALVPLAFFERARSLLAGYNLSPILFSAGGEEFAVDDCYVFAEAGKDLVKWDERIVARAGDLVDALRRGEIKSLTLDSPRAEAEDRQDWRATVDITMSSGTFYLGLEESLMSEPSAVLSSAYAMARDFFDVRYGIAYKSRLEQYPDGHASGFVKTSLDEVLEMIRHRKQWDAREKTPDELWTDELRAGKRHLAGLFRAAYPANILSEAHLQSAGLTSASLGRFSELDKSLYLWELSNSELPAAQAILESRRVLVSQNR